MIYGLTGGIASGKSTVSRYLKDKGFPVIDADTIARDIVQPGKKAYNSIIETFGNNIIGNDFQIDRKKLGDLVFNNSSELQKLNNITHPEIKKEIKNQINILNATLITHIFLDIPLLFEGDWHKFTEKNIVVYTSKEKQIERLIKRNNLTYEEAIARINSQIPLERKLELADIIIDNNGTIAELYQEIESKLSELL